MNIQRLTTVRDYMAGLPPEWIDMSDTNTCIAGYTCELFAPIDIPTCMDAADILEMPWPQAWQLFLAHLPARDIDDFALTKDEVLAAIDSTINTGAPVWPERVQDHAQYA